MSKEKRQIVKDSIADAKVITEQAEKRASEMFIKEFSGPLKNILSDVINENVSTGSDQPGGYNQNAEKDAISGGKDINDGTGDGPDNLQEGDMDIPDDNEENPEEVVEEGDVNIDADENPEDEFPVTENEIDFSEEPGEEDDMYEADIDINADDEGVGEVPVDDEVIEVVDQDLGGEEDENPIMEKKIKESAKAVVAENKKLKEIASKLQKQKNQLLKDVKTLKEGFDKLNLFNAKLAYAFKLMRKPGVTRQEKKQIAEAFDKVKSIREAKLIFETFNRSLTQVQKIEKSPLKNKNVKTVVSEKTQLNESLGNRMSQLAGLDERE